MDRSRKALSRMRAVGPPLILISAAVVGVLVSSQVRQLVISGAANTIASGAGGMAASYLTPAAGGAVTVTDEAALDAEVRRRMKINQVLAYRLHALDGSLLYSANEDVADSAESHGEAFEIALDGEVGVELVTAEDDPTVSADTGTVMKVYAPVMRGDGQLVAVADIYKPYEPVAASVRDAVLAVWLVVGLGALITAGTLGFMAQRALRQMVMSERQVASLNSRLDTSMADLEQQSLGVLQALSAAVDARDQYTAQHSLGATAVAFQIGLELALGAGHMVTLERASLLHDVGKIGVPESLLLKPGALTDEEFDRVKEHAATGARILELIPSLTECVPVVRHHHERWDGRGYPDGLRGEDIPLLARILAVADSFDAMVSERPYQQPMRREAAVAEVKRCAATQFDPMIVEAFLATVGDTAAWIRSDSA